MKTFLRILVVLVSAFAIVLPSFAWADEDDTHGEYVFDRGDKVDTYNGILTFPKTDLFLPGKGGLDLKITRTYSSQINEDSTVGYGNCLMGPVLPVESPFGMGWHFLIGKINIDEKIIYYGDGGSEQLFYDNYDGATLKGRMKTRQYAVWEYDEGADTSFLKMPSGIILKFYMNTSSSDKYVIQIEDKNGNHIDIEYRAYPDSSFINQIYDTLGRTISFTYVDTLGVTRLRKISYKNSNGNTSDIEYEYYFAKVGKPLSKVTFPNGTYESYGYEDWSQCTRTVTGVLLDSVSLPTGGRIEYLYQNISVSKWLVQENDTDCDTVSQFFTWHSAIKERELYDAGGKVSHHYFYYDEDPSDWYNDFDCHNLEDYSDQSYPDSIEGRMTYVEEAAASSIGGVDYIYYPYIMTDDTSTGCMEPWYVGNLKSLRWYNYVGGSGTDYIKTINLIYDKQIIGYTDSNYHTEDSAVWIPVVKDIYKSSYSACDTTLPDRDTKAIRYIRESHTGAVLKSEVYSLCDTLSDWKLDNAQQYLVKKDTVVNFEPDSIFNYFYVDSAMSIEENDTVHNKYYYSNATQGSYLKSLDSTKLYSGEYTLVERLAYDTFGNVSQTVDPNSDTLYFGYDTLGAYRTSVSSSVYGIMDSTTYYDNSGLVKTKVDANGNETEFYYDSADRIEKIVKPLDSDSSIYYTYDNSNRINCEFIKQNSSNFIKSSKHFDEFGRLYETRIYNGNDTTKTTTEYDPMGKPKRVSRAFENTPNDTVWTEFKYDILGRTAKTINPDDSEDSTHYHELTVERIDELDQKSKSIYDVRGNLLYSLVNWDGNSSAYLDTISYTYGAFNLVSEVKDPKGFITKYWYTPLHRLSADSTADGGKNLYIYDKVGNLRFRKDANGDWIYNKYDQLSRLIEQGTLPEDTIPTQSNAYDPDYPDGISEEWEIKNKYDSYSQGIVADDSANHTNPQGNLTEVWDQNQNGHTSYFYDKRNRLAQKDVYISGLEKTIKYHYNQADQVDILYYPDSSQISYEYDQMGRLVNIPGFVEASGSDSGFEYTPWGTIEQISFNNSVLTLVDYNDRSFVTKIRHKKANLLWGRGYGYDATGNIIREYSLNVSGDSTGMLRVYQYDNMYRLTSAVLEDYDDTLTYGYDENGNRTFRKVNSDSTAYFYNSNTNQLSYLDDQDPNNYVYNSRGSLTQDSSKVISLSYDYRNMLRSVKKKRTLIGQMVFDDVGSFYNSKGQRVKKTYVHKYVCSCGGDPTPLSGGGGVGFSLMRGVGQCICTEYTHTYYFYSGGQVIAEYNGDGDLIAKYVYGNGQRLAKVNADGDTLYYHNDYLGSTRIMTDSSGSNIFERDYYPFGTELLASGSETDYKYNGKEFDDEVGHNLYYYGARFYDTNLSRFTSVDPVNEYTNPYSYVGNHPINRADPTGMAFEIRTLLTKGGDFGGFGDLFNYLTFLFSNMTHAITLEIDGEIYLIAVSGNDPIGELLADWGLINMLPPEDEEGGYNISENNTISAPLAQGTIEETQERIRQLNTATQAVIEYGPEICDAATLTSLVLAAAFPEIGVPLLIASRVTSGVGFGLTTIDFLSGRGNVTPTEMGVRTATFGLGAVGPRGLRYGTAATNVGLNIVKDLDVNFQTSFSSQYYEHGCEIDATGHIICH